MTVIVITEENHGFIGLVKDVKDVINFLIDTDWIDKNTDIFYYDENKTWKTITLIERYGDKWKDILSSMNLEELSELFDGGFYFEIEEVYEKEEIK